MYTNVYVSWCMQICRAQTKNFGILSSLCIEGESLLQFPLHSMLQGSSIVSFKECHLFSYSISLGVLETQMNTFRPSFAPVLQGLNSGDLQASLASALTY